MKEIISLEKTGAVATVTIDRGGKRNALSQEMVLRLTDIALQLQQDTSVACIVLSGNQNEFSAGIDLALHLVAVFAGQALAERTARQMDYRWISTPHDGTPHVL